MADTVGSNPTSQGTLPGRAAPIPTLERQESTQAETSIPGFGQAFSQAALQPSVASETSSAVIASTGIKLGEIYGAKYAEKNPNANLIPSITKSGQAFEKAYTARSEQILGTQANRLINESQATATSAGELTDGLINDYHKSASEGIEGILKNAPDNIRNQMMYQYQNHIDNTANKMRMNMISEQQTKQKEAQVAYNNNRVNSAWDTSFSGGLDEGKLNLDIFKQDLDRQLDSSMINQKQYDAFSTQAKMNSFIGAFSKDVSNSRANEKLPPKERNKSIKSVGDVVNGVYDKLPKSMPATEKMTIAKGVLDYAKQLHATEAQSNQLKLSELNEALADGTINSAMLADAEQTLPPEEYNNFMAKFWNSTNKAATEKERVTHVANNLDNPFALTNASPSDINKGFNKLVERSLQDNPDQDPMVVKTGIAKESGVEIPEFSNELDTMLTRGSSEQAYTAMLALNEINDYEPQNVKSVSKQGMAMATMLGDLHGIAQLPLNDAWEQAKEAVITTKREEVEFRELGYKLYHKDNLATQDQVTTKTKSLLDLPFFGTPDVPNMPYVANTTMRLWKDWYMATGSSSAADKLTKASLKKNYGDTHVNGTKQRVFMPVEKLAGVGDDAQDIIHNDMAVNLSNQLQETKDAYDAGNVDWYYRVNPESIGKAAVKIDRVYRSSTSIKLPSEGVVAKGNINLESRPQVRNKDGVSTVLSMSIGTDKGEVLIPRVSNDGKILSESEAINLYKSTGKHLGIFKDSKSATRYAKALHEQQQEYYKNQVITPFNVQISASQNLQRTQNAASPISGYYDVSLLDESGFPAPLSAVNRNGTSTFAYRPNLKAIKDAYAFRKNRGLTDTEIERENIKKSIERMTNPSTSLAERFMTASQGGPL